MARTRGSVVAKQNPEIAERLKSELQDILSAGRSRPAEVPPKAASRVLKKSLAPETGVEISFNCTDFPALVAENGNATCPDNGRSGRFQCPAGVFQNFCVESDVEW